MVSVAHIALVLSAFAIIVALTNKRGQSIPSKYEAERRIREKLQTPNGELNFEYGGVQYHINHITVERNEGWKSRFNELLSGDISGKTTIVFSDSIGVTKTIETDNISKIDSEGVRALIFAMDATHPTKVYNEFCESLFELSKEIS